MYSFPEGTDLNDVSVASSVRYAEKMGIERTHYTMHPRVRGFIQAAQCLTDRTGTGKRIDAVYNVTMAYDDFSKVNTRANSNIYMAPVHYCGKRRGYIYIYIYIYMR